MPHSRSLTLTALAATAALLLTGCGSEPEQASSGSTPTHVMPDGSVMSDSEMQGMSGRDHGEEHGEEHGDDQGDDHGDDHMSGDAGGPSDAAAMICSDEIEQAVQRTLGLSEAPVALDSWDDPTYRCTYQLPDGDLRMQVADLDEAGPGRAWFDDLRQRLDAKPITGMQSLGLVAFETSDGDVGFLKDHKTLWVDASRVGAQDLPAGLTRTEAAYGVAAAVVACWKED